VDTVLVGVGDVQAAAVRTGYHVVHCAESRHSEPLQKPIGLSVVDFDLLRRFVTQHVQTVVETRNAEDRVAFVQRVKHVAHCITNITRYLHQGRRKYSLKLGSRERGAPDPGVGCGKVAVGSWTGIIPRNCFEIRSAKSCILVYSGLRKWSSY